ncbi:MAG: dihydroorotase [Deltaproteobacteria bacterium]|nr:dihydroorotase [Deltaproteobacteria bacterium]
MTIRIQGGRVVDPVAGTVKALDLLIRGECIAAVLPAGTAVDGVPEEGVIDATGKLVVPGLIDMHVHLREPGQEHKETIATGALAGVVGGYSALACMPNTDPVNDCGAVTRFILERARRAGLLRVYPIGAITLGQKGVNLADFEDLRSSGAVAVSDDGRPVEARECMARAMIWACRCGLAVVSHCEDLTLSGSGVLHEGSVSARLGLKGIPAASEEVAVRREIDLARETRCPVHIAHVSTAGSVCLIREAKEEGLPVTAETAPHYFTLDHGAVLEYNTSAKMNPPLRTPEDVEAVRRGLAEDVIDVIATDHAPHSSLEKDVDFERAAFGIIGLETALPLTLALVEQGFLSLSQAVRKLSLNPARILGVEGGRLEEGKVADLAMIDMECSYSLDAGDIHSRSKNSPFLGRALKGRNVLTMVGGRVVWKR